MSASPQAIPIDQSPAADTTHLLLMPPLTPDGVTPQRHAAFDHRPALRDTRTIHTAFFSIAACRHSHPAVITTAGAFSYRQIQRTAAATRRTLAGDRRFRPGDRVIVLLANGPTFPAALYGVMSAGGVAVPLPPDVEADRLAHVTKAVEAAVIISDEQALHRRRDLHDSPRIAIGEEAAAPEGASRPAEAGANANTNADEVALILFTSGSSGDPKGVMLSHRNVLANTRYIWNHLPIDGDDRALSLSACCHAFGHGVLQSHLLRGATLIFDGAVLFPSSIADALRDHEATSLAAVPDAYRFLLRRTTFEHTAAPSLRYLSTAGSALTAVEAAEIAQRVAPARFFCLYGQTESTSRICIHACEDFEAHPGSIGRGGPDIEVEVVDETGLPIPVGATGEVRARAENVMLGYWRDPEATKRVLRDGWLYTGDLATIDEHGFIYLRTRADHLVKIGGHRVSLSEIESLARQRLPVTGATAVTFETPEGGTRLGLFVQPADDNKGLTPEAALNALKSDLPRHKIPAVVEVLESFPRTASMKVDRMALVRRATSLAAASDTIRP